MTTAREQDVWEPLVRDLVKHFWFRSDSDPKAAEEAYRRAKEALGE